MDLHQFHELTVSSIMNASRMSNAIIALNARLIKENHEITREFRRLLVLHRTVEDVQDTIAPQPLLVNALRAQVGMNIVMLPDNDPLPVGYPLPMLDPYAPTHIEFQRLRQYTTLAWLGFDYFVEEALDLAQENDRLLELVRDKQDQILALLA